MSFFVINFVGFIHFRVTPKSPLVFVFHFVSSFVLALSFFYFISSFVFFTSFSFVCYLGIALLFVFEFLSSIILFTSFSFVCYSEVVSKSPISFIFLSHFLFSSFPFILLTFLIY